ncbi:aminopeptidase [Candidatus Bathyarchaeota archaeon]|nr:MAG: aminopeptidase [Candidatus Bathyarchaeota archaeon]
MAASVASVTTIAAMSGATAATVITALREARKERVGDKLKIYILTDLEGVAGIVLPVQTTKGTREYEEARHLLTAEVNAAVEGILSADPEAEIYVNDGHDGGFNLVLDEVHEEAKIVHGSSRPFSLGGLDETFSGVFLVGYHSMAGSEKGVLSHTMSSRSIYRVLFNGAEIGEIGIESLLAGYYGVPVALVTGDKTATDEAKNLLGKVETVTVKWGLGRTFAISLSPRKARRLIKEGAIRAIKSLREYKPLRPPPPYEIVVEYLLAESVDVRARLKGVEKVNDRTIKVVSNDLKEALMLAGMC